MIWQEYGWTRIDIDPNSKPRMVKSDSWKGRPEVAQYWKFKDDLGELFKAVPSKAFEVVFVIPMAESWTNKKKIEFDGKPHHQTPDTDNLLKAFLDAKMKSDKLVFHPDSWKFWGREGCIYYRPLRTNVTLDEVLQSRHCFGVGN